MRVLLTSNAWLVCSQILTRENIFWAVSMLFVINASTTGQMSQIDVPYVLKYLTKSSCSFTANIEFNN